MDKLQNLYTLATIIVVVYELVARIVPTEGNWSIIHKIVILLDRLVKNKTIISSNKKSVPAEFTVTKVTTLEDAKILIKG